MSVPQTPETPGITFSTSPQFPSGQSGASLTPSQRTERPSTTTMQSLDPSLGGSSMHSGKPSEQSLKPPGTPQMKRLLAEHGSGSIHGSHGHLHGHHHHHGNMYRKEPLTASTASLTWSGSMSHLMSIGKKTPVKPGDEESESDDEEGPHILRPEGTVTFTLACTALLAIFGSSFPHGWNTGVMNAPQAVIQQFLNESYYQRFGTIPDEGVLNVVWATSVAVYLVGGCGGAFSVGWLSNKLGRRNALLVCHIFGFISAVLFGACKAAMSMEMLILARLIVGFGCGAGSGLVPMYLVEIAPVNIRGAMGVLHQFALTCGILVSQGIGFREVLGGEDTWPYLLALTAAPCVVSAIFLPFCPESPRYLLVNKNDKEAAEKALIKFRGHTDVKMDIDEMLAEQEVLRSEPEWSFLQLLKDKSLRLPLILVCSLAMCQQLSGINVVFYYSTSIFVSSGIPGDKTQYAVLGTGVINVIMTAISVFLMEKSGRRPLLLGGMIMMIASATTITIAMTTQHILPWMAYISIICIITFVIGFAIGLGSIPQFIPAELFKQGPRPPAMSISGFLNWFCNFLIGLTFPPMQMAMKEYSFIPFIFIVLAYLIFFWVKLPETKNKSYDEIYELFAGLLADQPEEGQGDTLLEKGDKNGDVIESGFNGKAGGDSDKEKPQNNNV